MVCCVIALSATVLRYYFGVFQSRCPVLVKYMWCLMAESCKSLQAVKNLIKPARRAHSVQKGKFRGHTEYNDGSGPQENTMCFGSDLSYCLK